MNLKPAFIGWAIVAITAAVVEGTLLVRHQAPLTQAVWFGPVWFRITMAASLLVLLWHFYLQKHKPKP